MSKLSQYLDDLEAGGCFVFSRHDVQRVLDTNHNSLNVLLHRQKRRGRLQKISAQHYVIVPLEFKHLGAPPCEWYLDYLMEQHQAHYYVGLLSAAAYYGASHHQPQSFQVIVNKRLKAMRVGRSYLTFFFSKSMGLIPCEKVQTPTGSIYYSSPEGTAFDLLRYQLASGHLNQIATVLAELGESLNREKLLNVAQKLPLVYTQRLGYLLEKVGYKILSSTLSKLVALKKPRYALLQSDASVKEGEKSFKWRLIINSEIEPDL